MPEMTDVHLPLNLNIQSFRGSRITSDTHRLTVRAMLLKVSGITTVSKLDTLDIDASRAR